MSRTDRIVNLGIPVILALNAVWVLVIPSFPTLDGWTHLHTARILMDGSLGDVYCPNEGPVPNRVGHWILGGLQLILPALAAERVLLVLIIGLIGFGTWYLAKAHGLANPLILLVLPFTWNFMLVMGFHNFLLGTALALIGAAFWIRTERPSRWHLLALAGWTLLLLETHATGLLFFLLITAAHAIQRQFVPNGSRRISLFGKELPTLPLFFLACLPAVILLARFQLSQDAAWGQADPWNALHDLKELRPLLLYDGWDEGKFAYAMKLVLIGALVTVALVRSQNGRRLMPALVPSDILLFLALFLFVVHPFIPDSTGSAGYITVRMQWMGLLLLCAWIGTQELRLAAAFVPLVVLLLVHQARLRYVRDTMAPLKEAQVKVLEAAQQLPEGSIVLPVSNEPIWVLGHISSLLAVERKVTLLDNYECSNDYFPLRWCPQLPEPMIMHLGGQDTCMGWLTEHVASGAWPVLERIVVLGTDSTDSSCRTAGLERVLAEHYTLSFSNGYARIHARRPGP